MRKHCIFEHFLRFVEQIRAKVWVIVTLHLLVLRVERHLRDAVKQLEV